MYLVYPIPPWWLREYIALSYYHHQIGSMNYHPLFRARSWNNGTVKQCAVCLFIFLWVENIQQHINKYLRKWLHAPPHFSIVDLCNWNAPAPILVHHRIIQGWKKLGSRRFLGLTGWRHIASIAWSLIKAVTGATHTERACSAIILHRWLSREDSRGRRDMVITKLNIIKKEKSGHCYRPSQAMSMD